MALGSSLPPKAANEFDQEAHRSCEEGFITGVMTTTTSSSSRVVASSVAAAKW
jgi:hypothetical protein